VLAELDYWCNRRLPAKAWLTFLDDVLAGVYRIEPPTGVDLARCRELQARNRKGGGHARPGERRSDMHPSTDMHPTA
jgi:hypothetical protein